MTVTVKVFQRLNVYINYRHGLKSWQQDKKFPIDENYQTKIYHKCYYQIQGQMFILNLDYCDFFIWSPATSIDYPNYLKIHVEKNDEFINACLLNCKITFLKCCYLKYLHVRMTFVLIISKNYYCICRRPCFEPLIASDANNFDIEWYHYACVNIKIAPKRFWFCKNFTAKNKTKKQQKNKKITKNNKKTKWLNLIAEVTFQRIPLKYLKFKKTSIPILKCFIQIILVCFHLLFGVESN